MIAANTMTSSGAEYSRATHGASGELIELSILMPCLNEAETIANCIRKAQGAIDRLGIRGEILIADNGSTDGSQAIARSLGARVLEVVEKGYGNALRGGSNLRLGGSSSWPTRTTATISLLLNHSSKSCAKVSTS